MSPYHNRPVLAIRLRWSCERACRYAGVKTPNQPREPKSANRKS